MFRPEIKKVLDRESFTDSQGNTPILNTTEHISRYSENFATKWDLTKYIILITGIALSMFMMSLNSTVVAPAMSIIATELNATENQTWIATAYLVAVNAFQPLSGKVKMERNNILLLPTQLSPVFFFFSSFTVFRHFWKVIEYNLS